MGTSVIGVGYEGLDADALVSRLRLRGVSVVVDVRLNAVSRKRGLSKSALSQRLADEGIGYEHLPALGNPRDNREGFANADDASGRDARSRFEGLLDEASAQEALDRVEELAERGTVALLCFERDEDYCHRKLVLDALKDRAFARA